MSPGEICNTSSTGLPYGSIFSTTNSTGDEKSQVVLFPSHNLTDNDPNVFDAISNLGRVFVLPDIPRLDNTGDNKEGKNAKDRKL